MKTLQTRFTTIIVILGLILLAPYFSGMLIEKYYQQLVTQLSNELKFKVSLQSFERKFFSSTAVIELHIEPKDNKSSPYVIPVAQSIVHGPIVLDLKNTKMPVSIALAHIHHTIGEKFKAQLVEFFHNEDPLTVMTKLGFLGKGTTYFSCVSTQQTTASNFSVIWDGLEGKIQHSLDLRNLSGEITAPKLNLKDSGFNLQIANISSKFNTTEKNNLAIGDSTLHIGEMLYQEQEDLPLLKLTNLDLNSSLQNDNTAANKLIYALIAKVQSAEILQQKFTENKYELQAKSITPEFFTILHANYDKKFALLGDLLKQLLNNETNINITIPGTFSKALMSFCNLQLYKNSIIGKIDPRDNAQVFTEITSNVSKTFERLIAHKIFIVSEKSDAYKLSIDFTKAGKVLLNGEQLQNPLAALAELDQPEATGPDAATPVPAAPAATNEKTAPGVPPANVPQNLGSDLKTDIKPEKIEQTVKDLGNQLSNTGE